MTYRGAQSRFAISSEVLRSLPWQSEQAPADRNTQSRDLEAESIALLSSPGIERPAGRPAAHRPAERRVMSEECGGPGKPMKSARPSHLHLRGWPRGGYSTQDPFFLPLMLKSPEDSAGGPREVGSLYEI